MTCIFKAKPLECSVCMDVLKLQCFMNHPRHIVSEEGKADLRKQLTIAIRHKDRTKE
jgi:hypothetical protein